MKLHFTMYQLIMSDIKNQTFNNMRPRPTISKRKVKISVRSFYTKFVFLEMLKTTVMSSQIILRPTPSRFCIYVFLIITRKVLCLCKEIFSKFTIQICYVFIFYFFPLLSLYMTLTQTLSTTFINVIPL